jgi:hypothetical protein
LADARTRARLAAPAALAGFAVLAVALVLWLPQIVRTATSFDATQHFASEDVRRAGGLLKASFSPVRLLDDLNLAFFFTPLVPLLLVFLPQAGARDLRVVLALALSWGALAFVLFPAQGAFRDWTSSRPWVSRSRSSPARSRARGRAAQPWLAAVPALCLAGACLRSPRRGTATARGEGRGDLAGPPVRTPVERAGMDYLGASCTRRGATPTRRGFRARAETRARSACTAVGDCRARRAGSAEAQRVLTNSWSSRRAPRWRGPSWGRSRGSGAITRRPRAARALARLAPNDAETSSVRNTSSASTRRGATAERR